MKFSHALLICSDSVSVHQVARVGKCHKIGAMINQPQLIEDSINLTSSRLEEIISFCFNFSGDGKSSSHRRGWLRVLISDAWCARHLSDVALNGIGRKDSALLAQEEALRVWGRQNRPFLVQHAVVTSISRLELCAYPQLLLAALKAAARKAGFLGFVLDTLSQSLILSSHQPQEGTLCISEGAHRLIRSSSSENYFSLATKTAYRSKHSLLEVAWGAGAVDLSAMLSDGEVHLEVTASLPNKVDQNPVANESGDLFFADSSHLSLIEYFRSSRIYSAGALLILVSAAALASFVIAEHQAHRTSTTPTAESLSGNVIHVKNVELLHPADPRLRLPTFESLDIVSPPEDIEVSIGSIQLSLDEGESALRFFLTGEASDSQQLQRYLSHLQSSNASTATLQKVFQKQEEGISRLVFEIQVLHHANTSPP